MIVPEIETLVRMKLRDRSYLKDDVKVIVTHGYDYNFDEFSTIVLYNNDFEIKKVVNSAYNVESIRLFNEVLDKLVDSFIELVVGEEDET